MAAEPKLTNVSIVVVGGKMPQMDLVERLIKKKHEELNDNLVVIDVRKHMINATPGHAVIEGQDGAWPQTAISVYAHPQFAKLVTSIITFVAGHHDGDNMIVVLKGKTGYHRADVVARTLKDALNSLMEISRESGELAPVFNANMFSLAGAATAIEAKTIWFRACDWHSRPWACCPMPPVDQRFAHLHHAATAQTTIAYKTIWEHVNAVYTLEQPSVSIAFGTVADSPDAVYPIAKPLPKRKRKQPEEVQDSGGAASSIGGAASSIGGADSPIGGIKLTPRPPNSPPRASIETCICCGGRGKVRSRLEQWETHEEDVHVWANVLDELGADKHAKKELFNLATAGPQHRVAAGMIIHKVLKKSAYGDLDNVSAFIASSVKGAWHQRSWA